MLPPTTARPSIALETRPIALSTTIWNVLWLMLAVPRSLSAVYASARLRKFGSLALTDVLVTWFVEIRLLNTWLVADDQLVFQAGLVNSASKLVFRKVCICAGVMALTAG